RADGVLRSGASADQRSDCGKDSGIPNSAPACGAVQQFISRQLHVDRLRMAVARQVGAAVHASAGQRDEFLSFTLGLESVEWLRHYWTERQSGRHGDRVRPLARRGVRAGATERLYVDR